MISVIVPVYNEEKRLEACIKSLLDQTLPRSAYEIILVDNGSTDKSVEIIKKFPVIYLSEGIASPYRARNTGVRAARGEILAFVDSDCRVDSNWLKNGMKCLDQFDLVTSNILPDHSERHYLRLHDEISRGIRDSKRSVFVLNCLFFVKKTTFENIGGFEDDLISAADGILFREAKRLGYSIGTSEDTIVYHAVDSLTERIKRSFREGLGALAKDKYMIEKKVSPHKLMCSKMYNVVNTFVLKVERVLSFSNRRKLKLTEIIAVLFITLLFHYIGYFGVFVAKIFPNFIERKAKRY